MVAWHHVYRRQSITGEETRVSVCFGWLYGRLKIYFEKNIHREKIKKKIKESKNIPSQSGNGKTKQMRQNM